MFASKIICISDAVERQFCARVRNRKTLVLRNGIPSTEFGPVSQERIRGFRNTFSLGDFTLVGVIGRLKMLRKGQDTFLRSAALLAADYPDVRFVLIGSPFPGNESHLVALKKLGTSLGIEDRVIYTGDVPDIQAAYAALDISVLPSGQPEPLGNVVIESMASGKPVVATNVGGPPELIEHQETGLLVPPGDPDSLASALRGLLDDDSKRERFGKAGRLRFEKLFEFEAFYHRLISVYSDTIASRPLSARSCI